MVDLREYIQRGLEHIGNSVDRARDCRPYFRFNLTDPPIWAQHEAADRPHTVGRFLHALNVCTPIVGLPDDAALLDGLRRQIYTCCDHDDGFAWDDMAYDPAPVMAHMHHQREALLGLIAVWEIFHDQRARRYARALVQAMDKTTRATGTFPGNSLAVGGWRDEPLAVTTSERAISALLAYTRTFDDDLGLELAERFGRHALGVTFGPNGELTRASGKHIHSISGTTASLIELGLATGQKEFVERGRRVFDLGLLPYRTQAGWVKENTFADFGRGEANCTADLIEVACLLGAAGYRSYYHDAERMLRNHLAASQLNDLTWVAENHGLDDTDSRAYQDLRRRAGGAFCFAEPHAFHSYNSDLTGAALQGLAVAWRHIVTREADDSLRINLLLSTDQRGVALASQMPERGRVTATLKAPVPRLTIQVPSWCIPRSIEVTVSGVAQELNGGDDGLVLTNLDRGAGIELSFDQPELITEQRALGYAEPHRVQWRGNTVMAMSGTAKHMALYPTLGADGSITTGADRRG